MHFTADDQESLIITLDVQQDQKQQQQRFDSDQINA